MRKYTNVPALGADVTANGSHWFDADTMRFFGTRIDGSKVYGGRVFVASHQPPHGPRVYWPHFVELAPNGMLTVTRIGVSQVSMLDGPTDLETARRMAKRLGELCDAGKVPDTVTSEDDSLLWEAVQDV